jgi:2-hydroxychromene-2-carboxylate isomerase
MRGAVLAKKLNLLEVYADKMFDAIWVKALNLNDQMIMSEVAIKSGIDGNDFAEGIMSEEIKNGLKINTQYALDNGAFGVPTFYFNNEMYWGIDSMKFLIDDLNK